MSSYGKYYKAQDEKQQRQFEKPKRTKKYCWKLETTIDFLGPRCCQDGCPYRYSRGCMEDERLVV